MWCFSRCWYEQWRIQGEWWNHPFVSSDREFLHCFVSFVISRLNCKIRVSRLPCFLPVKNCGKMHPNLSFWGTKNDCFLGRCPAPPPHPTPLDAIGASSPSYWNPKYANDWARDIGTDNGTLLKHNSSLVQNWFIWVLWLIWADNYLRLGLASVRASRSERPSPFSSSPRYATDRIRMVLDWFDWLSQKAITLKKIHSPGAATKIRSTV